MAIQDKFSSKNVIYKITSDVDLEGGTLTVPAGCTLDFQGGSINNGTVRGNGAYVSGETSGCSAKFEDVVYFTSGQETALNGMVVEINNRMVEVEDRFNDSLDDMNLKINYIDNKVAKANSTASKAEAKADSAISTSNEAANTATIAKNAVATLEGLADADEAQQTLAAQVVQIEENKQNIALNKAETDEKLTELATYLTIFPLEGGDDDYVQKCIHLVAGRSYRIDVINPHFDRTSVSDGKRIFAIYHNNASGNTIYDYSISKTGTEVVEPYYIVDAVESMNNNRYSILVRANINENVYIMLQDITDVEALSSELITNGVINLFSISNVRPEGFSEGDIYYNTSYNKFIKNTSEGLKEYTPTQNGLFVYNNKYYRYNGYSLEQIKNADQESLSENILIKKGLVFDSSKFQTYSLNIPEKEEYKCNILVTPYDEAEYMLSIIYVDGTSKVIQSWTTQAIDIPYLLNSDCKSFKINCSSGSIGKSVDILISAYIPSNTSLYMLAEKALEKATDNEFEIGQKVDYQALNLGYAINRNSKLIWEQGHINNGVNGSSSADYFKRRIRTVGYIDAIDRLYVDKGFKAYIYKYSKDDVYVESSEKITGYSDYIFDFENFNYRIALGYNSDWEISSDMYINIALLKKPVTFTPEYSVFNKQNDFGIVPSDLYTCKIEDYSFGLKSTNYEDIISLFDTLVDDKYITKEIIGSSSDGREMYAYNINVNRPSITGDYIPQRNQPKFVIVSGQHGFEKSSIFAMFYLMKDIKENHSKSKELAYLRYNVNFAIVPVANPYGVDNNLYVNANGVNLNRNWGVENWQPSDDATEGESEYAGVEAFDQPETSNIRNYILNNTDASIVIDWHTQGSGIVTKNNINWISVVYPDNVDSYYKKIEGLCNSHIIRISTHMDILYSNEIGGENGEMCGRITSNTRSKTVGYLESWATFNNFIGITFEGNNGLPNESEAFSEIEKKANAELMGNFIIEFCKVFGN